MTTFPEAYAEDRACHHNDAAVAALQEADKDIWLAAYHSAKQWGTYKQDGVRGIARDAKKSPSQIENYAHAFDLLVDFHRCGHVSEIWTNAGLNSRRFMRALTPSHFWKMWTLRNTYNIPTTKCLVYISNAAVHGWSGEVMIENVLADINKKRPPLKVATVRRNFANAASEILSRANDFTVQAERDAAQLVLNLFGDALKEVE